MNQPPSRRLKMMRGMAILSGSGCNSVEVMLALASDMGHAVRVKPVDGLNGGAVGVMCAVVIGHGAGASRGDALDGDG